MKQSLQLKIGQQLTMTPQLQQAIRLLQLSTVDLQQEIQTLVESNPMLELSEEGDEHAESDNSLETNNDSSPNGEDVASTLGDSVDGADEQVMANGPDNDAIPDDLPVDSQWDDIYQAPQGSSGGEPAMDAPDLDGRNASLETLQDHLTWQLNLTPMSDLDRMLAIAIIDAVEPNGFLSNTLEEIYEGARESFAGDGIEVEFDEFQAVQHRIQRFDPLGVASVDLRDCLLVQLLQMPADTPWLAPARQVVDKHLQLLGNKDFAQLQRKLRLKEDQLRQVVELIQGLDPRPGDQMTHNDAEYIVPDVFVKKANERWVVELNPDVAPRLRINNDYASLIKRADNSADNNYLRNNLQEARWFLKSLQSRNETLMKVASRIVEHQQGFLEYGEEAMKPLVLHDIAEAVDMHESTISRVTTQKYMHTPSGIFELKYFFSSHVGTDGGGECSSTAIRAIIKKLVAAETPKKPLSDNKIAQLLAEQGIKVARRTIAKYRESLGIPPSNERKRLV